jgi:GNAT superfamily N-acetyltransferase
VTDVAERIARFERVFQGRLATRTESTPFGTAFFHEDFPRRYDSNFVWVDAPLGDVNAQVLAAEADRVLGGAGLEHRHLYVDDAEQGARLLPGLVGLGYLGERLITMVRVREPDRWNDDQAEEVDAATIGPFLVEVNREADGGAHAREAEMLADFRNVLAEQGGARFFVCRGADRIVSVSELYVVDDVAQVEAVYTLEVFRGLGLGRAVVLAGVRAALGAGCDLVFLNADDDDWPKMLYGKLGFDEVARFWSFVKASEG